MINLDITFFIQLVNFLVTLVVLNLILIRPVREVIRKRAERMAAQIDDIEGFNRNAESRLGDYQAQLDSARRAGVETRMQAKAEATAQEKVLLDDASQEAASTLRSARDKINAQVQAAMGALKADVDNLAQRAAAKILG